MKGKKRSSWPGMGRGKLLIIIVGMEFLRVGPSLGKLIEIRLKL